MDEPRKTAGPARRVPGLVALVVLVVAGEAAFCLPFHVARFFRPTLLAGLGITNTELGALFSAYGVVAALCYFPGGVLADRFPARRLMCASMLLTGAGGVCLARLPGLPALLVLYAGFGLTTILLFWAALIRATRDVGGPGRQGTAFGALDGGRGLFAAGLASLAWVPFQAAFVGDPGHAGSDERVQALRAVILVYTAATFIAAALVWLVIDEDDDAPASTRVDWPRIGTVLVQPAIWLQALIVFAAYCAYKGIDNYSLYLMHAHHLDEVEAAQAIVSIAWLRPVAALGAGVLADRIRPTRVALLGFGALVAGSSALAFTDPGAVTVVWIGLTVTCAAAFGLRGVYFALMGEARVPTAVTGTAVGLISMIGFLPEIFIAPVSGWLLDRSPGLTGHHEVFLLLTGIGAMGLITTLLLARRLSR